MEQQLATKLADIILAGLFREYPNVPPTLLSAEEVRPTRERTPIFYGCYDWHSAVHSHWALARLLAHAGPRRDAIGAALKRSLSAEGVAGEVAFLSQAGRTGFEMPYGMAWLLLLCAELATHPGFLCLAPLEELAAARFSHWLSRLSHPIRSGEHSQSAFAMGLAWDSAQRRGHSELARLVRTRAREFYQADRNGPVDFEPSAYDFLSPVLGEADLMRRLLGRDEFVEWLDRFLPRIPLRPVIPVDRAEGKLAHFDGLNLSRAWMLRGVAEALPATDVRRPVWEELAREHARAGLEGLASPHYAGSHWLGSFAVYWLSFSSIP